MRLEVVSNNIPSTLVRCEECGKETIIESTDNEKIEIELAWAGWHRLLGRDFCSDLCQIYDLERLACPICGDAGCWSKGRCAKTE